MATEPVYTCEFCGYVGVSALDHHCAKCGEVLPIPGMCPGHDDYTDCEDDPFNPCEVCREAGERVG